MVTIVFLNILVDFKKYKTVSYSEHREKHKKFKGPGSRVSNTSQIGFYQQLFINLS